MAEKKTHWLYRIIRWFVWLFSPKYKLEGTERLPKEPCVIVGNHSHMYGPIAAEIYTPGKHMIWCAGEMMDRKEVAAYAYRDFWSGKPKAVRWFYKLLSRRIGPLAELIFNNAHTVAVYHDARLIGTYRKSLEALQEGCSLVIFPECYEEHNNIVHAFQEKFVDLARFYYQKTGKELQFVPMYLAPQLKTICYGEPICFCGGQPIREERTRICGELMDAITQLALALPEHRVVPYPNVSRKHYHKNIPLEVYDEAKTES